MENNLSHDLHDVTDRLLREDDDYRAPRGSGSRLVRIVLGLFSVHTEVAKQELSREQGRLLSGLLSLFIGLSCLSMLILLLQGVGIWFCLARGLSLGLALLIMAGVDLLLGGLFLLLARRALSRPLLPETRALVRRTITAILP
ncbi:MAG: phage holin family protein [Polyangia bacterium]